MKSLFIICVLLFCCLKIKANPDTTSHEKMNTLITNKLAQKCDLTDSSIRKLKAHFKKYENAWNLCRLQPTCGGRCNYLIKEKEDGILSMFGKEVYDAYLHIKEEVIRTIRAEINYKRQVRVGF